jgi:hypothetical protein
MRLTCANCHDTRSGQPLRQTVKLTAPKLGNFGNTLAVRSVRPLLLCQSQDFASFDISCSKIGVSRSPQPHPVAPARYNTRMDEKRSTTPSKTLIGLVLAFAAAFVFFAALYFNRRGPGDVAAGSISAGAVVLNLLAASYLWAKRKRKLSQGSR